MLKSLAISGSVVTIDTIGCQKNLCKLTVVDKKASYVIGLKANKQELYEQVAAHFKRVVPSLSAQPSRDLGYGWAEKRVVRVSEDVEWLDAAADFAGVRSVVCVVSSRWIDSQEVFLISSILAPQVK